MSRKQSVRPVKNSFILEIMMDKHNVPLMLCLTRGLLSPPLKLTEEGKFTIPDFLASVKAINYGLECWLSKNDVYEHLGDSKLDSPTSVSTVLCGDGPMPGDHNPKSGIFSTKKE